MIETRIVEDRRCPILICDGCGKQIEKANDGLVIESQDGKVEFRHRYNINSACDVPGEAWEEISTFFSQITNNLKIDMEAAAKKAWRAHLL